MFSEGIVKPGEICPGMTWEHHADSVARFNLRSVSPMSGFVTLETERHLVLGDIDGDPQYVKEIRAKSERNS